MSGPKTVFISYSHDSEPHKQWVLGLASFLVEHGINVVLDQWDVALGDDLAEFMERSIRDTDRVLVICTDKYVQKANGGVGGVGYEKTIVTAQILSDKSKRRKFVPIVRDVVSSEKLPTFFGAALYLDLSEGQDTPKARDVLLQSIYEVNVSKPQLGTSSYLPTTSPQIIVPPQKVEMRPEVEARPARNVDPMLTFSDRFAQAFPGVRGIQWLDDPKTIAQRLAILMASPLTLGDGQHLTWWWRGMRNMQVDRFEHLEARNFLMDVEELNIKRIAAVNGGLHYRTFLYVETNPDPPTGLYKWKNGEIEQIANESGFVNEEYGLVDGKLPVRRAEYDDGAAIIDGEPVDIRGRVELRVRYITSYNFFLAPNNSPLNNPNFDLRMEKYLGDLLGGKDVFDEMCKEIFRLPRKNR